MADYGNFGANVNQMRNRNALTQNALDPNSLDNRYRQAQLNSLENPPESEYTLSKGDTRMRGDRVIASRPDDSGDPFAGSFTLGNNRYRSDGTLLVKGEPDQTRVDGENKRVFEWSDKLRDEFATATKPFATINDAYSRIEASAEDPSAAGDMALIFNYMKMLDPGSVVRESEFALAASSGDYGERIQSYWNQASSGKRLADSIRADFVDRSKRLYTRANVDYKKRADEFTRIAKSFNLDPKQIIYNQAVASREGSGVANNSANELPAVITTQSEYDALPSGAVYIEDGKPYRKP